MERIGPLMFMGRPNIPLALDEPVLRWCKESDMEIPDVDVQRQVSMFRPYRVYLSFIDPDAAFAFKMRWF